MCTGDVASPAKMGGMTLPLRQFSFTHLQDPRARKELLSEIRQFDSVACCAAR